MILFSFIVLVRLVRLSLVFIKGNLTWLESNALVYNVYRRSPHSNSLSLQVVPDILDDQSKEAEAGTHSDQNDSASELESLLREASAAGTEALPSVWTNQSSLAALTETSCRPLSVVQLGYDARPLTPAEMVAHYHLITRTRPNWNLSSFSGIIVCFLCISAGAYSYVFLPLWC